MSAINSPGLCPDPLPDDIQDELTQLRARVKELESDSITHLGIIGEKESRIRELEEAMPLPCVLRAWAMDADAPAFYTAANGIGKPIRDLADRIDAVMNKSKEN